MGNRRLAILIAVASLTGCRAPDPLTRIAEADRDIAYGPDQDHRIDVWRTKGSTGLRPAVLVFHGGGWESESKATPADLIRRYVEKGYVVASVEYRRSDRAKAPAAVLDARLALRWFADHAARWNSDPARLVVTGYSAGGHLALMAAFAPETAGLGPATPVRAVVNLYGVADVTELTSGPFRQRFALDWLPPAPELDRVARQVSPLSWVRPGLPPVYSVHGEMDSLVPVEQSERLTKALRGVGVTAEFRRLPGVGHGTIGRETLDLIYTQILEFLLRQGA